MIALLEAFLGSKVGRFLAEVLLILVIIVAVILHYEHKGASEELGKLKISSAALIARANVNIAQETAAHTADVKANQEKTDAALAQVTATNVALADSVQRFDAYRRAHPDVPRPSSGGGATRQGECGAQSCGDLASELAVRGNELAGSVGELSATLQSCQRDRDSLTGLPRETK